VSIEQIERRTDISKVIGTNTFGDCECGRPLVTKNVETNTTVGVDIWMINSCCKVYLYD
jgi:hypothetical protein